MRSPRQMSVATFQPAALSAGLVVKSKMDRKRAVSGDDDLTAPPGKRLNGGGSTGDVADVPKFGSVNTSWQVDLEVGGDSIECALEWRC